MEHTLRSCNSVINQDNDIAQRTTQMVLPDANPNNAHVSGCEYYNTTRFGPFADGLEQEFKLPVPFFSLTKKDTHSLR